MIKLNADDFCEICSLFDKKNKSTMIRELDCDLSYYFGTEQIPLCDRCNSALNGNELDEISEHEEFLRAHSPFPRGKHL